MIKDNSARLTRIRVCARRTRSARRASSVRRTAASINRVVSIVPRLEPIDLLSILGHSTRTCEQPSSAQSTHYWWNLPEVEVDVVDVVVEVEVEVEVVVVVCQNVEHRRTLTVVSTYARRRRTGGG